jgi:hypothetical protein
MLCAHGAQNRTSTVSWRHTWGCSKMSIGVEAYPWRKRGSPQNEVSAAWRRQWIPIATPARSPNSMMHGATFNTRRATMRVHPTFSAIAIVTIALGIGANVAIFSVVRALLLQPLPYVHPERLVRPYENVPASESSHHRAMRIGGMNALELAEIRERTKTLSQVSTVGQSLVTMLGAGDSAFVNGASLSPGTPSMLGVRPARGRWFTPDEESAGSHVVVLSHATWRRYFAGAPDVLNKTVTFTGNSTFVGDIALGTAYTIIGVMPRGFHFPDDRIEFWTPAALTAPTDRLNRIVWGIVQGWDRPYPAVRAAVFSPFGINLEDDERETGLRRYPEALLRDGLIIRRIGNHSVHQRHEGKLRN